MGAWLNNSEIIDLAFDRAIEENKVDDTLIESVQVKHVLPILGEDFYNAIDEDISAYSALVQVLRPMIAYFVKYYILPRLHIETGSVGMARIQGQNRQPVNQEDYEKQRGDALEMAQLHGEKVRKYLEDNADSYPLYYKGSNPQEHISVSGGIIMRKRDTFYIDDDDYTMCLKYY